MKPEKRFNLWDIEGTAFIEDHKEGSYHIGKTEDVDINSLRNITKRLNIYAEENEMLKSENDSYKNMFFEIVETALTDTNCKELYCKGILDIFDKANSLNQAREMIKEHLK